jgi:hypothetical protein
MGEFAQLIGEALQAFRTDPLYAQRILEAGRRERLRWQLAASPPGDVGDLPELPPQAVSALATVPAGRPPRTRKQPSASSKYRGVVRHSGGTRWQAYIRIYSSADKRVRFVYLGLYEDEIVAARVFDQADGGVHRWEG